MTTTEPQIAFWVLFVVSVIAGFIMATQEADGAGTPFWEPFDHEIDEDPVSNFGGGGVGARGANNIIYRVWQDDDYSLYISYTDDNGTTLPWQATKIIGSSWKGHTTLGIGGIVVLANNTVMVHFITSDADDDFNSYVACRWNWAGPWEIIKLYGGVAELDYPKMAVNETMVLLWYVTGDNTPRHKTFDPVTKVVEPPENDVPEVWIGTINGGAGDYDLTVNQSGYFIICHKSWSGSTYRFHIQDFELTHVAVYATVGGATRIPYGVTIACTSDDLFVVGSTIIYVGINFYGLKVWHGGTPWGAMTSQDVQYVDTREVDPYSMGSCIDDDDRITFYWANDTGGGGGTYISKMTGDINYTDAEWEAEIVNQVYDYGTNDDAWYGTTWYDCKYPIVGGYSVNIPNAGWMGHHTWMDEAGSPDDYAFALYWNASFHWYDVEVPEEPEEPDDEEVPDPGIDWNINPDTFIGLLWIIFIALCVCVALIDKIREISTMRRGG